jgi:hypothetical protein
MMLKVLYTRQAKIADWFYVGNYVIFENKPYLSKELKSL